MAKSTPKLVDKPVRQYRYWSVSTFGGSRGILKPVDMKWSFSVEPQLRRGRRFPAFRWPRPAPLFTYSGPGAVGDFPWVTMNALIVSAKAKEVLEAHAPGTCQFLRVRVKAPRQRQRPFWIVNWLRVFDCETADGVVDRDRLPEGAILGLVGEHNLTIMARDDLKRSITKAGLTRLFFTELECVRPGTDRVQRWNVKTRRMDSTELRLDPTARQFDARAYLKSGRGPNDPGSIPNSTAFLDYVFHHSLYKSVDICVIREFLRRGGDPNVGREPNVDPILLTLNLTPALLRLFVRHGADVNIANGLSGRTPLIGAAENGDISLLRELVRLGARVNQTDAGGRTAVHCVAHQAALDRMPMAKARKVLRFLVGKGANLSKKDAAGYTAIELPQSLRKLMRGLKVQDRERIIARCDRVLRFLNRLSANSNAQWIKR